MEALQWKRKTVGHHHHHRPCAAHPGCFGDEGGKEIRESTLEPRPWDPGGEEEEDGWPAGLTFFGTRIILHSVVLESVS